jgi:Dolichyl-phosphate-mannose-protein mannosyltransferase
MRHASVIERVTGERWAQKRSLAIVCLLYLALSAMFASSNLDIDEFTFIREPYEMLGGDYTTGYLREHNLKSALATLVKSYYFYWKYRPLFSPIVSANDKKLFQREENHFGYVKPVSVSKDDINALGKYSQRLIVPEPDRFYTHGAGKPLLPAILSTPQLALVRILAPGNRSLLYYQYRDNYHPIFIVTRLAQILSGLFTILLTYRILESECGGKRALLGAALVAFLPVSIKYFPNLHHDSILAPFSLASAYLFYKGRYKASGLFFGLALASKNVAVLLVPAFIALIIGDALYARREAESGDNDYSLNRAAGGLATVLILGVLVLTPFADPISYAQEILTPFTHRARDPRGEDVQQFTLQGRLSRPAPSASAGTSTPMPAVEFTRMIFRLESNDFFFLVIACVLFWSRRRDRLSRLCFIFLLCSLPYGLIFGYGLNYRSLQFVPFFAIACATVTPQRYLPGIAIALLSIDLIYCSDPIRTDYLHVPVNKETLWGSH